MTRSTASDRPLVTAPALVASYGEAERCYYWWRTEWMAMPRGESRAAHIILDAMTAARMAMIAFAAKGE